MTLRILWCSDAPDASSGYSQITRQQVPMLAELGHEVALLATFGHHGAVRTWHPPYWPEGKVLRVYPGGADSFANDVIGVSARDWQADIVITLKDSFVFRPDAFQGLRWLPLVPVDHEPLAPAIAQVCHNCYRPIAYAPNGFRELRKAGFDPLFAPHSYDPRIFYPEDRKEARAKFGFPEDMFVIGTVAVNRGGVPSRKAWPQNLKAFSIFAKDKPNARYFVHTDLAQDGFEGGVNIPMLCAQYNINGKVIYCDQTMYRRALYPDDYLRTFYNAIDVLNCVSLGEGFGLPGLEAQVCGCPVIMSQFAAHRDLCFAGWHVPNERGHAIEEYDGQNADVFKPDPRSIAEQMEKAYQEWRETPVGIQAFNVPEGNFVPAYITRKMKSALLSAPYALDRVIQDHWKPLLEEVEHDIANETSRGVLRIVRREEVGV